MPAKKDSNKGDNKSYLNKRSKAQLEDIISQFGYEDVLEAEPVKTDGAVAEDTAVNMLNNDDEYGLDEFKSDDSALSVSDSGKAADSGFTDLYEEAASDIVKEDEYGISEFDGFNSVKADEPPAEDTAKGSGSNEYSAILKGLLSEPEPEPEPEPEKDAFVFDGLSKTDEAEVFADKADGAVQEIEQQLGEVIVEAAEEPSTVLDLAEEGQEPQIVIELAEEDQGSCAVVGLAGEYHEPAIDISFYDMREQDTEIDYSYDLDSGCCANKRVDNMKKEKVVKEKTAPQAGKDVLSEPAMPATVLSSTEPAVGVGKPHPAKAKLVFSPKTDKINKRLRKKYKIDKDNIFSENDYVDGFILANNETLLRRYDALKVNGGNVGRILITNKRMLFNTSEKAEIPLSAVEGLRSAKYWAISWAKFIFGILLLGIAAGAFIYDFTTIDFFAGKTWLIYTIMGFGGLFALIGLILLFRFARRRFALKIFINSSYEFITYNSNKRKKETAVIESVIFAKPGKELDKMVREIGALIMQSREGFFD